MSNRSITISVGKTQRFLQDRGIYPVEYCDIIEDLISCNKANLSKVGGSGSVRFTEENGHLVVGLVLDKVNSFISYANKSIICIRSKGGSIKANAYYGDLCDVDFTPKSEVYSLDSVQNHVQALKDFMSSWVFKKGELGAEIIIVDRLDVFENIKYDDAFKNVYLLCSE